MELAMVGEGVAGTEGGTGTERGLDEIRMEREGARERERTILNSRLTVFHGRPLSHQEVGWDRFTGAVLRTLSKSAVRAGQVHL